MFSFRQQMGWRPIVVFKSYGVESGNINSDDPNILGSNGKLYCSIEFEIWNRRKYPIVINVVDVSFSGHFIDHSGILLNQKEKTGVQGGAQQLAENVWWSVVENIFHLNWYLRLKMERC
ncbi:hypothetical protein [Brevundimonas pishanensis]|uniref:hypothetical protein n=1 Tax=Brevundimonas pishanensis TaxID=2896315 RepID=UPI001FA7FCDD|nr:hypothetical protein [Brevundimonas pishanensis]